MSKNDIRAIEATTKPKAGYMHFEFFATVSEELFQQVAGFGMETVRRDELFPDWELTLQS